MNVRDLIPWNRDDRGMTTAREGYSPLFDLQRDMNRIFDDFFRGFDRDFGGSLAAPSLLGGRSWPTIDVA